MLNRLLVSQADHYPGKIAFACGTDTLTYRELATQADVLARNLAAVGVASQDCVLLLLPDGKEFVIGLFAIFGLRAIALPLAPSTSDAELVAYFRNAAPRLVLTSDERVPGCRQILAALKSDARLITTGRHPGADCSLAEMPSGSWTKDSKRNASPADDPPFEGRALYLYTSGSEGTPKRICRRQRGLVQEGLNFTASLDLGPDDHFLCLVPLCHSYGLGDGLLAALCTGATLVMPPPRTTDRGHAGETPAPGFGGRIASLIDRYGVRVLLGVPYQYALLASLPETAPDCWQGLKYCFSSGSLLTPNVFEQFRARFGLPVRSIYGSTEMGTVCVCRSASVNPETVGPPVNNVEVRIHDDHGRQLPHGTAGNIWVKSEVIPETGYDDEPDLNSRAFLNGFFKSGDVGKLDAPGDVTIVGRKEVFIESGGHKINSREVEECLRSHPAVKEAAVVGIDYPEIGEVVYAFVASGMDLNESDLLEFCRSRLAFYKVPHRVEFCTALPKSPLGKVLKKQLQQEARQMGHRAGERPLPETIVLPLSQKLTREPLSRALPNERRRMLTQYLSRNLAALLNCPVLSLDQDTLLETVGLDSLTSVKLAQQLSADLELTLSPTFAWNYPTIGRMVSALLAELNLLPEAETVRQIALDSPLRKKGHKKIAALLDEIERLPDS